MVEGPTRSGSRLWLPHVSRNYFLFVYEKDEAVSLSAAQKQALAMITRAIKTAVETDAPLVTVDEVVSTYALQRDTVQPSTRAVVAHVRLEEGGATVEGRVRRDGVFA